AVGRGSAAGRGLGETTPRARAAKAAAAAAGPRPTESTTGPRSSEATSARAEAAGSFLARTRLTYREAAAHEGLLVEALDGLFGDLSFEELDEGESAGAACLTVDRNDDVGRIADGCEMRPQVRLGCPIRHVADEQTYSH